MIRTLFIATAALGLVGVSSAQNLTEYLKLRRDHGVRQAVGIATLQAFVGERVLEVSGTIKGSIRMDSGGTLMLETLEGTPVHVRAGHIPQWLLGQSVRARLLMRATRAHENAGLEATLLGAIDESTIANHEAKNRPAAAKPATRNTRPIPSRGGSQPRPMQGQVREVASDTVVRPTRDWQLPPSDAVPYYAQFIRNYNKRVSAAQATRIAEGVVGFSLHYGVDARLVMALLITESGFNPNAKSHAGAMGLGQLMPGTARELGVTNAYDTTENLYGTVKLLSQHIGTYTSRTGDDFEGLTLALAAYNAGPGAVRRHGGVPPYRETQNYVRKVIALYKQLCGN